MCEPWFKVKNHLQKNRGVAFSSNYELYADISMRVMQTLEHLAPKTEIYSIDEAFLDLTGVSSYMDLEDFGYSCKSTVMKWTGDAVRVGIGPTKTLSKSCKLWSKEIP